MSKLNRFTMTLALLIMAVGGAWADEPIVCTSADIGKVLCTDGSIYATKTEAETAGREATGVIVYVNAENTKALAIALADESTTMKYQNALDVFAAKATTVPNGKWVLPSKEDWENMFTANGGNVGSCAGLNAAITAAGGTALVDNAEYVYQEVYWTSTPGVNDPQNHAFNVNLHQGTATISEMGNGVAYLVRGAIEFAVKDLAIALTPNTDKKVWTLDKMPAGNIELQVEYEPTKVTMAVNNSDMGTVEVGGESKVEWTAETWQGWNSGQNTEMTKSDGGITMTYTNDANNTYDGRIREDENSHALEFFINEHIDDCTVTFSSDEGNISRIELSMTAEYSENSFSVGGTTYTYGNPHILPLDGWTFEGKSAVWEGEATKSLTLQSCSTSVSKITFFKGAVPDGVTVNGDGTFTVAKTATVTLTATPAEGYKFLYWADDPTNTNPVREVTIESGMADMTYTAVFAEILYNVTFVEGTNLDEWTATPNTDVKKDTKVDIEYTGAKKVIGVKVEEKKAEPVADIIWDGTNVTNLNVESTYASYTKEGVKLSGNADQVQVKWNNSAYLGTPGMEFITMESGGFTFTAPTGKKFTKIEMKAVGSSGWAQVNLGTGWAYNTGTVTWNGSADSTVKLLKDADMFSGDFISSIAFYLSE